MTQGTITHPHTSIAEGMQMEQPELKPEAQRIIIEICLRALARKQAREAAEREQSASNGHHQTVSGDHVGDSTQG